MGIFLSTNNKLGLWAQLGVGRCGNALGQCGGCCTLHDPGSAGQYEISHSKKKKRGHCWGVTVLGHLWAVQVSANSLSACGCCTPIHSLGTDSIPTSKDSLPGGTYRNAGPWHEGKEGGCNSSTGISVQEIPHVLGMRNALCQALGGTVLAVKVFWLVIPTRGFTRTRGSFSPIPKPFPCILKEVII